MSHSKPYVNLGKLVILENYDRLVKVKIIQKYFSMSEWDMLYSIENLKKKPFQQAKDVSIQTRGWRDTTMRSLVTKSLEFLGVSQSNPNPEGDSCRGLQKHMHGRWYQSLRLGRCEFPSGS